QECADGSAYSEPCPVGTFLLRFSETELGGVTIAWVSNSSELSLMNPSLNDCVQISQRLSPTNTSSNVVMHLQPFVAKDLTTRPLADRIRDLKDLVYLYPNIPKDDAFEALYKSEKEAKQPWVSTSPYHKASLEETVKFGQTELTRVSAVKTELGVDGGKAYRELYSVVKNGGNAASVTAALTAAKTTLVPARYTAPLEAEAKGRK
ncbi:MAG: hypothetical protein EOP83_37300, partial [Verrucomicrobiaceae bacterium]